MRPRVNQPHWASHMPVTTPHKQPSCGTHTYAPKKDTYNQIQNYITIGLLTNKESMNVMCRNLLLCIVHDVFFSYCPSFDSIWKPRERSSTIGYHQSKLFPYVYKIFYSISNVRIHLLKLSNPWSGDDDHLCTESVL